MRWQVSGTWELRVTLVDELPDRVIAAVDDRELPVPPYPWLEANDPDVADLRDRLRGLGWALPADRTLPAGWPGAG